MDPLYLNREQSRLVDRLAVEQYGMDSLVLMENAGRGCADVLCELGIAGPVVICCGKGNNAGDGFVIARHLELRGHAVQLLVWTRPADLSGDAAANFSILEKAATPIQLAAERDDVWLRRQLEGADWVVDALLGTGARGEPRPPLDSVIGVLNESPARKLAVDLPSGLDCDQGQPASSTFRADHTCTFVAAKTGFQAVAAQAWLGQLHVLDIGTPRRLLSDLLQQLEKLRCAD